MKGFEALGMGLALLLVPLLAWAAGRSAGRRDSGVIAVIIIAMFAALLGLSLATAASSTLETLAGANRATFPAIFERRVRDLATLPEFVAFLGMFAVFVSMVGWSSVPAYKGLGGAR